MKKYIYHNKKTGQKIYSDDKINLKDFVLVMEAKNIKMSPDKIIQKNANNKNKGRKLSK